MAAKIAANVLEQRKADGALIPDGNESDKTYELRLVPEAKCPGCGKHVVCCGQVTEEKPIFVWGSWRERFVRTLIFNCDCGVAFQLTGELEAKSTLQ